MSKEHSGETPAKKSTLEIVLMPLAITLVGGIITFAITVIEMKSSENFRIQQIELAERRAAADRDIKVIEIFYQNISKGTERDQNLALRMLGAISPDLHKKLAVVVLEFQSPNSETQELARQEVAKADQRIFEQVQQAREPATIGRPAQNPICAKYGKLTYEQWADRFYSEVKPGTFMVYVASLPPGMKIEEAEASADRFELNHPNQKFVVAPTISPEILRNPTANANHRYAIAIAKGLSDLTLAREIAQFASDCGIAPDAYAYQQRF
jgi:hypothetical protein